MAYSGEIRLFAGNYVPSGWAACEGQMLPIAEYEVLFTLIGTTYGGDGQQTFALPDLRGRVPVGTGQLDGAGNLYTIGEPFGVEQVNLTVPQLPQHNHALLASGASGTTAQPAGNVPASAPVVSLYARDAPSAQTAPTALGPAGGSLPHENRMPVLAITYIICLAGQEFPTQ
jgi:microcystin-dependent protein